jgi:hypothetical protein
MSDAVAEPRLPSARRCVLLVSFGVLLLVITGVVWIVVTGLVARYEAHEVRAELATLKADLANGDEVSAQRLATTMAGQASTAHSRTTGPAWWFASKLPYVGTPLRTMRGGTAIVDDLAHHALPAVLRAGAALNPHELLTGPSTIDPQRLRDAVGPLTTTVAAVDAVAKRAGTLPRTSWLSSVDSAQRSLVSELAQLRRGIADLATAARLLPSQLGEQRTQRYFVAIESDAESRGLGGLPGSYAILRARHGQLTFTKFGSDADLDKARAHVQTPSDYRHEFTIDFGPTAHFRNSDPSPHFPYAARIWMSMWQDRFHQHLDGAITTDPTVLARLLGAVGPVTLRNGGVLSEANTIRFFENQLYNSFAIDNQARDRYQVAASRRIAQAVVHRFGAHLLPTATALQRSADDRRLLLYTAERSIERQLADQPVGGVVPMTRAPFLDVAVNNVGGDKLDYYLSRSVTYRRTSCAAGTATVTVTLRNEAPSTGLSSTVTGVVALGHPRLAGISPLRVSMYGTAGSSVNRITIDGKGDYYATAHERGHPVAFTDVTIPPGASRTLVFYVHEPPAQGPMVALEQPGVQHLAQTIDAPVCG